MILALMMIINPPQEFELEPTPPTEFILEEVTPPNDFILE